MRKLYKILAAAILGIIALHTVVAILLCEGTVHLKHKPLTEKMRAFAENEAQQLEAKLEPVQIASFDGTQLSAWFFRPQQGYGDAVILLHGHGDNRAGMLAFVPMFLRRQYAVLVPDSRAHGESGGDIATFGLDESRDLTRWVDWRAGASQALRLF